MAMVWWILGSTDNLSRTFLSLPTTLTIDVSNWTIWMGQGSQVEFNFLQTDRGITLDEVPESIMQLCTFLLKISKVSKKGGIPLLPGFWLFGLGEVSRLIFWFSLGCFIIMILGRESLVEGILRRSNNDILALTLFKSSSKLYSNSGITMSFCGWDLPLLGANVASDGSCGGGPLDLVLWVCCRLKTMSGSSSSSSKNKLTVLTYWSSSSSSWGGCESWFDQSSEDSGVFCVPVAKDFKT